MPTSGLPGGGALPATWRGVRETGCRLAWAATGRRDEEEAARMRFAGKTIVVTGAAGGLGSVMAASFAAEGGSVAVVDRRAARAPRSRLRSMGPATQAVPSSSSVTSRTSRRPPP